MPTTTPTARPKQGGDDDESVTVAFATGFPALGVVLLGAVLAWYNRDKLRKRRGEKDEFVPYPGASDDENQDEQFPAPDEPAAVETSGATGDAGGGEAEASVENWVSVPVDLTSSGDGAPEPRAVAGADDDSAWAPNPFPGGTPLGSPVLEQSPTVNAPDIEHIIEREDIAAPVSDDIEHQIEPETFADEDIELTIDSDEVGFMPDAVLNF